jgi:hypothetical protein
LSPIVDVTEYDDMKKDAIKAGAELCQAHFKMEVAKPSVARQVLASLFNKIPSYAKFITSSASLVLASVVSLLLSQLG